MLSLPTHKPYSFPDIPNYSITEELYLGSKTAVYRAKETTQGHSVVIKVLQQEYPSFRELVKFRNQYIIAKQLNSPGVVIPLSLEPYGNSYALVMEDFCGISLKEYAKTHALSLSEILAIALQLAEILNDLEKQQVVHKDIKPANILIHLQTHQVKLIDFSIASLLPNETLELQNPNVLEGTLAYLAPEQTGRMNRGIDYRADFYALGVSLYELLCGELPFQPEDPWEQIYCHIAQTPVFPDQSPLSIPPMVSAIVLKLMAKNPEDRYQNALGLKHDLNQCLSQWKQAGAITPFKLGSQDVSDRFTIPEKLYGREAEVQALLDAFARVSSPPIQNGLTQNRSEILLVAGLSGLGKTAVIHEVHKPITRQHGYFITGKFDQFNRSIPFSAFVQALKDLMEQLLSESDSELDAWRTKILAAIGETGQVLIEVIPALEQVIGPQPEAAEISGVAAQNRFNILFQKFIGVFTTAKHPLVMFLDDLQWADVASLQLIKVLMEKQGHLLLIGAYRDNEVLPTHPFQLMMEDLKQGDAIINTLRLPPLAFEDTNQLIADTLNCSVECAHLLSKLIFRKTQGNPFFTLQFLKALYEDKHISFNRDYGYWEWDIAKVKALSLTDDVVVFMAEQLQKLPASIQKVLKLAACIGSSFDLQALAIVSEQSESKAAEALWQAVQDGLILPNGQTYKFFQSKGADPASSSNSISVTYRFLHDRIQQAAYSLLPQENRAFVHLSMGRLLLSKLSSEQLQIRLFEVVNHLNYGIDLICDPSEKQHLLELNILAGQQAHTSVAYATALEYQLTGLKLLGENCWHQHYELTQSMSSDAANNAFLSGELIQMETLLEKAFSQTKTLLDQIPFYEIKIQALVAQHQLQEALQLGLKVLQQLGLNFPSKPKPEDLERGLQDIQIALANRSVQDLLLLPEMTDPKALASMQILHRISAVVVMTAPHLMPYVFFKMVQLSIQEGNNALSALGYATFGMMLCSVIGDIETGEQYANLALPILQKYPCKEVQAKILCRLSGGVWHWTKPLSETLPSLRETYQIAIETGDLEYAAISAQVYAYHSYFAGTTLPQMDQELAVYTQAVAQMQHKSFLYLIKAYHQHALNLLGHSDNPKQLMGQVYSEKVDLPQQEEANDTHGTAVVYLFKGISCYLFEAYQEALENFKHTHSLLPSIQPFVTGCTFFFYDSLTRLAIVAQQPLDDPTLYLDAVQVNQNKLQHWAHHAPNNHVHRYHLVDAEYQAVLGRYSHAIESYDLAIAAAKNNNFIQEEALAHELAAKFYLRWGKEKVAAGYMQEAYYGYASWGAKAKTDHLECLYPHLLQPILKKDATSIHLLETLATIANPNLASPLSPVHPDPQHNINAALDITDIFKASQALSGIIQIDELLCKLTQIILHNSGGDYCALILPNKSGTFCVEAITTFENTARLSIPVDDSQNMPVKLINFVKNTQDVVVIDNLKTDLPVLDDYLLQQHPKSVLCFPFLNQGTLMGILYLKNQSTQGVFTSDRILLLNFLCTQAAISLENSRLFSDRQQAEIQLQQSNEELLRATRLKDEFLANMSHELRTPLNAILGITEGLQEEAFGALTPQQLKMLKTIEKSGTHLLDLINDILDVAKIESGQIQLNTTPTDITSLIQSSLAFIKQQAHKKKIKLETRLMHHLPDLVIDERRIRQVLINILNNAVKFTPDGGQITLEASLRRNPKPLETPNASLQITIRDTGIGIASDNIDKLFKPFIQIDSALNRQYEGTGLGLALVKRIVDLHGGTVGITSEVGVGSCFNLALPCNTALSSNLESGLPTEPTIEFEQPTPTVATPLILLAEDNEANILTLSSYLKAKGYRVILAHNGREAINIAQLENPDLILMDIQMPVMDGLEAMKHIRDDSGLADIPIIALTALAMTGDRARCIEAGANDYLSKPVKLKQLANSIQECLMPQ